MGLRRSEPTRYADTPNSFGEATLRDIDAFISLVQREIEVGTHVGWEADDHHVRGGYERIGFVGRARTLVPALYGRVKLRTAIAGALEVVRAMSITADMTAGWRPRSGVRTKPPSHQGAEAPGAQ